MHPQPSAHLFLIGEDYHLGDLLWLTAVLHEYRRQVQPKQLMVGCPDRPISRILAHNPLIDELLYGEADSLRAAVGKRFGNDVMIHDLRPFPLAVAMLRDWRHHWPWLYYRDLWMQERGQWLATFLHLGRLHDFRPILTLREEDRTFARTLPAPYVLLAPHIGQYRLPFAGRVWHRIKGWEGDRWIQLAHLLREEGYEPITLAAAGQAPIPGTKPLLGIPIRQVAGVIEQATALISGESGLWFIAAASSTPFLIVPWWLPRSVDWAAPMEVPHRLIDRHAASVHDVAAQFRALVTHVHR